MATWPKLVLGAARIDAQQASTDQEFLRTSACTSTGAMTADFEAADVIPGGFNLPRTRAGSDQPSLHSQMQGDDFVCMQVEELPTPDAVNAPPARVLRPRPTPLRSPSPADFGPSPVPANLQGRKQKLKRNGNWTTESLKVALRAMEEGCKIREVARYFGIPASSLSDHANGRTLTRKRGWGCLQMQRSSYFWTGC